MKFLHPIFTDVLSRPYRCSFPTRYNGSRELVPFAKIFLQQLQKTISTCPKTVYAQHRTYGKQADCEGIHLVNARQTWILLASKSSSIAGVTCPLKLSMMTSTACSESPKDSRIVSTYGTITCILVMYSSIVCSVNNQCLGKWVTWQSSGNWNWGWHRVD